MSQAKNVGNIFNILRQCNHICPIHPIDSICRQKVKIFSFEMYCGVLKLTIDTGTSKFHISAVLD